MPHSLHRLNIVRFVAGIVFVGSVAISACGRQSTLTAIPGSGEYVVANSGGISVTPPHLHFANVEASAQRVQVKTNHFPVTFLIAGEKAHYACVSVKRVNSHGDFSISPIWPGPKCWVKFSNQHHDVVRLPIKIPFNTPAPTASPT